MTSPRVGDPSIQAPFVDDVIRSTHRLLVASDEELTHLDTARIRREVERAAPLLSTPDIDHATRRVHQLLFGLGPLEALLADTSVTEVMVNGPGVVWVERGGETMPTSIEVADDVLRVLVERIVAPLGLRVDRTAPFVDARLADGSRVNIAVPPLAVDGPYITIRRFRSRPHRVDDFCSGAVASLLVDAVRRRKNLIVSGATGAGKTSMLNALASHIPTNSRVITIEDAAELRLPGAHVVRLEARPPNAEGVGQVDIRSLVRNALRMRPDRIVVGEVRGAEALDMIQAMNTGHEGSMSTCHANSPVDALRRIEVMALMADVDLPVAILREHVRAAVNMIIHLERLPHGGRRVGSIYDCSHRQLVVESGRVVGEPEAC